MLRSSLLLFGLLITLSSCMYRMPHEDEFSTVPITNNPYVTKDKGNSLLPGLN